MHETRSWKLMQLTGAGVATGDGAGVCADPGVAVGGGVGAGVCAGVVGAAVGAGVVVVRVVVGAGVGVGVTPVVVQTGATVTSSPELVALEVHRPYVGHATTLLFTMKVSVLPYSDAQAMYVMLTLYPG